jgi:hypothetical protein
VRNRDLNELRRRASDVREALAARDYDAAREAVARLAREVDQVDDRAEGERINELKDAVSVLDEAIPGG